MNEIWKERLKKILLVVVCIAIAVVYFRYDRGMQKMYYDIGYRQAMKDRGEEVPGRTEEEWKESTHKVGAAIAKFFKLFDFGYDFDEVREEF